MRCVELGFGAFGAVVFGARGGLGCGELGAQVTGLVAGGVELTGERADLGFGPVGASLGGVAA